MVAVPSVAITGIVGHYRYGAVGNRDISFIRIVPQNTREGVVSGGVGGGYPVGHAANAEERESECLTRYPRCWRSRAVNVGEPLPGAFRLCRRTGLSRWR